MRLVAISIVALLLLPGIALAVEPLEFGLGFQGGGNIFFMRMGEVIAPDIAYGIDVVYGILPWIALDFDLLYSEHQQADSVLIGQVQFNHLQTGIGPRFSWHTRYVVPYATAQLGGNFFTWENKYDRGIDRFDGSGIAGYVTLGVDFYIADMATIGIAGKMGVCQADFEYYTTEEGLENLSTYLQLSPLVRFTLIF